MKTEAMATRQHWSYTQDEHRLVWLTLDRQGTSVNTLNAEVLEEFKQVLEEIKGLAPQALIVRSAKETGFIFGADIEQFKGLSHIEEATHFILKGQAVLQYLADLPFATIALVQGLCLGGGLELALACRYRIVEDDPKVRLGLPEVKLGIHPGWGGTVRLPALIGGMAALNVMLTGQLLRPKVAYKMGIIDALVPRRLLNKVVLKFALNPPPPHQPSCFQAMTNSAGIRPFFGHLLRWQLAQKVRKEHYPAPYALVDQWVNQGIAETAYKAEAHSVAGLVMQPQAANLLRVFFLQERLKKLGSSSTEKVRHVHVVGAGVMGGDIAAWCAFRGLTVTLQDQSPSLLGGAFKRAAALAQKRLKEPSEIMGMMDRLIPDVEGLGLRKADMIIEAITEKVEAKQALFVHLEQEARPEAILATNTSTIPLEEIRAMMRHPERLVGIHYFNPVALMPLVEVVYAEGTSSQVIARALSFVRLIDKLPLPVKSSPGFLVNRILLPYMLEAVSMLEEGVSGPAVDEAAKQFGLPMGPIELADRVGLDVCLAALSKMQETRGGQIPQKLRNLVAEGHWGEKTGQGFYGYKKGKAFKGPKGVGFRPTELIERLSLRLLNEAVACLREGLVEDEHLLDAGSIFGFGFPPFRGGIVHYIRQTGVSALKSRMEKLEVRFGSRFKPDAGWDQLSKESKE